MAAGITSPPGGKSGQPLPPELVVELRGRLFGDRVRRLREYLDITQAALRDQFPQKVSAGWLSGVENNNIDVAADRRLWLTDAFGLVGTDRELLLSEVSLGQHPETAYAAWQAVRLEMADKFVSHSNLGDREDRARAKRARDEIRRALQEDPARRAGAAGNVNVGGLTHYQTLPVVTRWMLLIEAAFMDPFAPFEPVDWYGLVIPTAFMEKISVNLETMLDGIGEELGLAGPDYNGVRFEDLLKIIVEAQQGKKYTPRKELRTVPGLMPAFVHVGDETSGSLVVRGADEVGCLGWWTACGMYLARNSWTQRATERPLSPFPANLPWYQLAHGGLSEVTATALGGSSLGATTAVGVAAARAHDRDETPVLDPEDTRQDDLRQIALFLEVLGPDRLKHDLARLWTFYAVSEKGGLADGDGEDVEPIPPLEWASQSLLMIVGALDELRIERQQTDRESSRTIDRLKTMIKQLNSTSRALDALGQERR